MPVSDDFTTIKFMRGTSEKIAEHTPLYGEPSYDREKHQLYIGDGKIKRGYLIGPYGNESSFYRPNMSDAALREEGNFFVYLDPRDGVWHKVTGSTVPGEYLMGYYVSEADMVYTEGIFQHPDFSKFPGGSDIWIDSNGLPTQDQTNNYAGRMVGEDRLRLDLESPGTKNTLSEKDLGKYLSKILCQGIYFGFKVEISDYEDRKLKVYSGDDSSNVALSDFGEEFIVIKNPKSWSTEITVDPQSSGNLAIVLHVDPNTLLDSYYVAEDSTLSESDIILGRLKDVLPNLSLKDPNLTTDGRQDMNAGNTYQDIFDDLGLLHQYFTALEERVKRLEDLVKEHTIQESFHRSEVLRAGEYFNVPEYVVGSGDLRVYVEQLLCSCGDNPSFHQYKEIGDVGSKSTQISFYDDIRPSYGIRAEYF